MEKKPIPPPRIKETGDLILKGGLLKPEEPITEERVRSIVLEELRKVTIKISPLTDILDKM